MLMLAALAAAAAASSLTPALASDQPWWERVTMTVSDDGEEAACTFESSLSRARESCVDDEREAARARAASANGLVTRITFERRFTPGAALPEVEPLNAGDVLIGGQVMLLAIDGSGQVRGCRVVATSGDSPAYGCREARAERFEAAAAKGGTPRAAFMTVLVYGHSEQLV